MPNQSFPCFNIYINYNNFLTVALMPFKLVNKDTMHDQLHSANKIPVLSQSCFLSLPKVVDCM